MKPIEIIIKALTSGASGTGDEAYSNLKSLILRYFADRPEGITVLEQHEKKTMKSGKRL
ncbi:MAG: hypothetical protein GY749_25105 [Desulfobacteraceae bacterium]|nr:hypothetical protein [Desulfobacteraceae bacterium]